MHYTFRGKEYRREIMCGHHMKKCVQCPLELDQFPCFLYVIGEDIKDFMIPTGSQVMHGGS